MKIVDEHMDPADQAIVARFAAGEPALREQVIAIHRRYNLTVGPRAGAHQQFLAEVDNVVPDLMLRAKYRQTVLNLHGLKLGPA